MQTRIRSMFSKEAFKAGSAWILLLLGILFYILGYLVFSDNLAESKATWRDVCIKFGDVLLIGVILGYFTNIAQYLGLFKETLSDIIYGKEFLSKRDDLPTLWENVSKEMFKNKFPEIHQEFLGTIKGYLPTNQVSYYNNYESHITLSWKDKEKYIVKATDCVSFKLMSESSSEFTYPLSTWTTVPDRDDFKPQLVNIFVNNKEVSQIDQHRDNDENDNCCTFNITLKGCTCYDVSYTLEKEYCILYDYYIGFRSQYIVNNMRVSLSCPDDIDATFIPRATLNKFVNSVGSTNARIEKIYTGIVLPKQGYIFALNTNMPK